MRVALDLSPLHRFPGGRWAFPVSVRRTVEPILGELGARGDVEVIEIRPSGGGPLGLWRQWALPRAAARAGAQVLHCFGSSFPVRASMPVVHTVHEAPWLHGTAENAGRRHRTWVRLGRARAARTCTPSPGVARDLRSDLPDAWPSLRVVPWGVGPDFRPERDGSDERLAAELEGLPRSPFVLCPGATRPKKRVDRVLAGAGRVPLVVAVSGTGEVPAGALALGDVAPELLPALFRRATAAAVLSDSEGFALPVLEALACGTPVVVPRGSVQADTAGVAGIGVDADDPEDVARGLRVAQNLDPVRRAAGLARAAELTWARTADRLVQVWRELA